MKKAFTLTCLGVTLLSVITLCAATATRAAETVTINPSVRYQTMRGWGATLSFIRDLNHVSQATVDQMIDESVNDLGLTFLRIGYGMLVEPFNDNSDPNSINWARFYDGATIDRDVARGMGRFNTLVRANGDPPVYLLDKDWENTAPSWMNDAEFAENITANILYFRDHHGIDVNFNSIDNEPNSFDPYTPERQRAMIKVMGPKFQSAGLSTKIALAEGIDAATTWSYIAAMQNDAAVWPHVGLLNWHLYGTNDPYRSQIRDFGFARGIPTGMTEYSQASIGHLMDDVTLGGASYWTRYFVSDGAGAVASGSNYFASALDGTSFARNIAYYQFRQFMHYVRPGAVRIDATSSTSALRSFAFDRNGTRVVVLVNTSGGPIDLTVQGMIPGRYGVSQTIASAYAELGTQDVGTSMGVTVAGNGVMTIYPAPANQAPTAMTWTASPSFTTLPGTTSVALSATAADTELEPITYAWAVKSVPAGASVQIVAPASSATAATGMSVAGTYVFTVTIRDTAGHDVVRDVTVRAYQGNQAPVIAEGHRYYKQEWIVPPLSSMTFGALFIRAFDLEGDPISSSFSVVSQPSGANASFSGNTVNGLTTAGTYTFRFTVNDPTHTVTRDFTRRVVTSAPSEDDPEPGPGGGRRRPASAPPVGTAVPRVTSTDGAAGPGAPATISRKTMPVSQPKLGAFELSRLLATFADWERVTFLDADDDGDVDVVTIELADGTEFQWALSARAGLSQHRR